MSVNSTRSNKYSFINEQQSVHKTFFVLENQIWSHSDIRTTYILLLLVKVIGML